MKGIIKYIIVITLLIFLIVFFLLSYKSKTSFKFNLNFKLYNKCGTPNNYFNECYIVGKKGWQTCFCKIEGIIYQMVCSYVRKNCVTSEHNRYHESVHLNHAYPFK